MRLTGALLKQVSVTLSSVNSQDSGITDAIHTAASGSVLTKFVDCKAECGSSCYHCCSAVGSVKELEQTWNKLVLVFIMSQSAVASKTPREYAVLTIKNHLKVTQQNPDT